MGLHKKFEMGSANKILFTIDTWVKLQEIFLKRRKCLQSCELTL